MKAIGVQTKLIGLLGHPLKQSFSPAMQNGAFAALALDYVYLPIEVGPEGLSDVIKGIRQMNFAGFNVTKPHKIAIMQHLDEVDSLARVIGAVNTVKLKGGRLKGYNTDGAGFATFLIQDLQVAARESSFFVLGCGGAGRAITTVLAEQGAKQIVVTDVVEESALKLAQDINQQVRDVVRFIPFGMTNIYEALRYTDILINATAIGMYPDEDLTPLSSDMLDKRMLVCDIIYNPTQTKLLREASRIGCRTANGLGMFIYQGAEAFKIWTGKDAPIGCMTEIIKELAESGRA